MKISSRREFLRYGGRIAKLGAIGSLSRLGLMNAWAQGEDYRALVCIFLFGGNDSDNTVIPVSQQYDDYQSVRGSIAIPRASLLPMFAGSQELGLHPSMSALHPLYGQNSMALLANVGMLVRPLTRETYRNRTEPRPDNLFSHSDQQRQWQMAPPNSSPGTGWGGRIADRMLSANSPSTFPMAVSVSGSSSLLVGEVAQPASIGSGSSLGLDGSSDSESARARSTAVQELLEFPSGFALVQAANEVFSEGVRIGQLLESTVSEENAIQTAFPGSSLGNQLLQLARVIKVRAELGMRRQIFFCSTGGYDTHSNQVGRHAGLLATLSDAIAAFHTATQELGVADKVTTFTESEFSRTFEPNGGAGTDHAWGGLQFIVGDAVRGGSLYGQFPELRLEGPNDADQRGRWIPTTSLDQFGATLASWFGLSTADVMAVFPNLANFPPASRNLGFMT